GVRVGAGRGAEGLGGSDPLGAALAADQHGGLEGDRDRAGPAGAARRRSRRRPDAGPAGSGRRQLGTLLHGLVLPPRQLLQPYRRAGGDRPVAAVSAPASPPGERPPTPPPQTPP